MAIIKQAKNIKIVARSSYYVKAGTLTETANRMNLEAREGNLSLISNKKILIEGKQGGVKYGDYSPPELVVEESEYKLESTYAHEQLCSLADELGEISFMLFMTQVFGYDIEASALSKLYRGLSDRKIKPPDIVVSEYFVGRKNGIAGYSNKKKKIIVYQKFVEEAAKDNDKSAELLAALVEEYGHHIDNLLRTELATKGEKDKDTIDEGAKFAYQLFKFDIFKEAILTYARAELPDFTGELKVDFSELHTKVTEYVNETEHHDEDPDDDISYYGAGRNRKKNKNAAFAHGDIEFEALTSKNLFSAEQVHKIYYGNWLRDFSQVIVGVTVRSTNFAVKMQKKKAVHEASPMKISHDGWVQLVEILAIKEFIYDPLKDAGKSFPDNFNTLKKSFDKEFGVLTKDILGLYRPEEHLDNPKGLEDESGITDDKGKVISFNDNGTLKKLYAGDNKKSWLIDGKRNMSNFFWIDFPDRPSSVTYVKSRLKLAAQHGQNAAGFRHLGAALHVLEDFFAHTNFTEIALRRLGADVYPWVQHYQGKSASALPVVSGTFLTDDTLASIAPKMADLLFHTGIQDYKRRTPKQRTLSETFILKTLQDLANGQKSDTAEKSSSYLGVEYSTWLAWFNDYLNLLDFFAEKYQKADQQEWRSKDFFEKLGARALETFQQSTHYLGQVMVFFPKLIVNIVLNSFDEAISEAQSHLNTNYGNSPSHTQIAKDAYTHPLNKLSAELAKAAVRDVGDKFKAGWGGERLADYVADTYFVHPASPKARWSDAIIIKWKDSADNKSALQRLKSATIFEHVGHQAEELNEKAVKKIKEIINFFRKLTG